MLDVSKAQRKAKENAINMGDLDTKAGNETVGEFRTIIIQ